MLLMTWMLLVTGRSKPSDGRLTRPGPSVPARRMASDEEPPPSRLIAETAPRSSISSASSESRTPARPPTSRPPTVARIMRPSAGGPIAPRGGPGPARPPPSARPHGRPDPGPRARRPQRQRQPADDDVDPGGGTARPAVEVRGVQDDIAGAPQLVDPVDDELAGGGRAEHDADRN